MDIRTSFEHRWRRLARLPLGVLGVLTGIAALICVAGFWGTPQGWRGLWQGLGPGLATAMVTYVLLDLVLAPRQRRRALISQMGSDVRSLAVDAARQLRNEGWLNDGSLEKAELGRANLCRAHLNHAKLRKANLSHAKLRKARLVGADLSGAVLWNTKLQEANLDGADLRGSVLWKADLKGATLMWADMTDAHVTPEQLAATVDLCGTTLRDGFTLSEDNWQADFEEWRQKREADVGRDYADIRGDRPEETTGKVNT